MKKKFSIAMSWAVILAMTLTQLVLAADPPAHVVFTTDVPCAVTVLVTDYTNPTGQPGQSASGSTPWTLDTYPSTPPDTLFNVTFFYPASVVCNGVTYNFQSVSPSSPLTSGIADSTTTVTGHYISSVPADITPPEVTVPADITAEATGPSGAVVTFSASANDLVDGALTPTCVPASGSTFPLGTTSVTCSATDAAGNIGSASFNILVVDTAPPTITFVSRLPAANSFGWNNTNVTVTWSCMDSVGVLSPTVTQVVSSEGSLLSATGTCTDTSGNTASDTQTGINIDKTAPTLNPSVLPLPVVLNSDPSLYTVSAGVSDALSGIDSQGCAGTMDTSSIGLKSVTCTATDKAGNFNSASVSYTVQYATAGSKCKGVPGHQILQPINTDGSSIFKQGSTVPAEFRVCGADGKAIGTPGVVTSFRLIWIISKGSASNVDQAVPSTTSDTAFRSGNQQWVFNINTKGLIAGNTYVYLITLNDGSTIQFQFSLK